MEQLSGFEIIGLLIIGGLIITWFIFYKDGDMASAYGFYDDVNNYLNSIDETDDLRVLRGYEWSLRIFKAAYRKDNARFF